MKSIMKRWELTHFMHVVLRIINKQVISNNRENELVKCPCTWISTTIHRSASYKHTEIWNIVGTLEDWLALVYLEKSNSSKRHNECSWLAPKSIYSGSIALMLTVVSVLFTIAPVHLASKFFPKNVYSLIKHDFISTPAPRGFIIW